MRQAVEAESPQPEPLAPFEWQCIGACRGRDRRVERRVETGNGRHTRNEPLHGADTRDHARLVQRRQRGQRFDLTDDVVVDEAWLDKLVAAVDDTMPDSIDRTAGVDEGRQGISVVGRTVVLCDHLVRGIE